MVEYRHTVRTNDESQVGFLVGVDGVTKDALAEMDREWRLARQADVPAASWSSWQLAEFIIHGRESLADLPLSVDNTMKKVVVVLINAPDFEEDILDRLCVQVADQTVDHWVGGRGTCHGSRAKKFWNPRFPSSD